MMGKHETFVAKMEAKWGHEYEVVGEVTKLTEPVLIKHVICGQTYEKTPSEALRYGCKCKIGKNTDNLRPGTNNFLLENQKRVEKQRQIFIDLLESNGYKLLEDYINAATEVFIRHEECGRKYLVRPTDFMHENRRCNCCNEVTFGETIIREYLIRMGYTISMQHTFDDLRDKRKLRFDFAVFNKDQLICLIEYDGEQHYIPNNFHQSYDTFEQQQYRDRLKDSYCKAKGIRLIRVPYFIDNIEQHINEQLKTLVAG